MKMELADYLKKLRLSEMCKCYKEQADMARRENLSYEEYLFELAGSEYEQRRNNRIDRRIRESRLPLEKTLQNFDRKRLSSKINGQLSALLEGAFTMHNENVLAFGNPGSGKTHLLCGIGHELIHKERKVLFRPCDILVQELLLAKRELELPRLLRRLAKYDVLIIDDIGYVRQSREEVEVLFTLLADSYERTSIMLTSNLPFAEWEKIFKDPMTTAAAIDRLVHHSIILELNLPSYRLEEAKKRKIAWNAEEDQ